jgi:hypothetical protein
LNESSKNKNKTKKGFNIMKTLTTILALVLFTAFNILFTQPVQQWGVVNNSNNSTNNAVSEDVAGNIITAGGNKLVKLNAAGGQIWEVTINGTLSAVCTDINNNIYVTGRSELTYDRSNCITIKYNSSGVQQWMKTEPGSSFSSKYGTIICSDNSGNVYVSVGITLYFSGAETQVSTIKYDMNGVKMFERSVSGKAAVRMIIQNNCLFVLSNSYLYWSPYMHNYYLVKYDQADNQVLYASDTLSAYDMTIDAAENIIITGLRNPYNSNIKFTTKYNSTGSRQWITWHNDLFRRIIADNSGNIYLTGEKTMKMNSSGAVVWSQTNNGMTVDIKLSQTGEIIVAGYANYDFLINNYSPNGGMNWTLTYNSPSSADDKACNLIVKNTGIVVSGVCGNNSIATVKYSSTVGVQSFGSEIPKDFNLSQNYPNPFNPSTKISFSIPKASFVKMRVYDIAGREVETLVNQQLSAGSFEVDFNASKLTSGIYFCRITADDFTDVKKMILAK